MISETTKDKDFKKFKEENQKEIKKAYVIKKVRTINDFVVDYVFLTKRPFGKNTLIQKYYKLKGGIKK